MYNSSIRQAGVWRLFEDMLNLSYVYSFACGVKPVPKRIGSDKFLLSPFHELNCLDFSQCGNMEVVTTSILMCHQQ